MSSASARVQVESLLREAGWHPSRRVPEALARWRALLAKEGFVLHPAAEAVLLEFGGLVVGEVGPGLTMVRSDVHLDPALVAGERDRLQEYFSELRDRDVYPLGEVHRGHGFLAIARDGEVFLVMDEVHRRWPSFRMALTHLLLGIRSQAV
jgi:hypothetical protein